MPERRTFFRVKNLYGLIKAIQVILNSWDLEIYNDNPLVFDIIIHLDEHPAKLVYTIGLKSRRLAGSSFEEIYSGVNFS